MARALTVTDWLEALSQEVPGDSGIALEFRVLSVEESFALVQPVIRAGVTDVWVGQAEKVGEMNALALSGFEVADGNLVLRNLESIL